VKVIGLRHVEFHHGGEAWHIEPGLRLDIGVTGAALRAIAEGYAELDEPVEQRPAAVSQAPAKPLKAGRTYTKRS
jgi:hypothetical protein